VRRIAVLAVCLAAALGVPPPAAAVSGLLFDVPRGPAGGGLLVPVQRRCVPSRCICRGSQPTACTRDCHRDRVCSCVRGRYVCSLYISR
jgi:hypothetical protein